MLDELISQTNMNKLNFKKMNVSCQINACNFDC